MEVGNRLRRAEDGGLDFCNEDVERSWTDGEDGIGAADTSRREVECTNRCVDASLREEMESDIRSRRWICWIRGCILSKSMISSNDR